MRVQWKRRRPRIHILTLRNLSTNCTNNGTYGIYSPLQPRLISPPRHVAEDHFRIQLPLQTSRQTLIVKKSTTVITSLEVRDDLDFEPLLLFTISLLLAPDGLSVVSSLRISCHLLDIYTCGKSHRMASHIPSSLT